MHRAEDGIAITCEHIGFATSHVSIPSRVCAACSRTRGTYAFQRLRRAATNRRAGTRSIDLTEVTKARGSRYPHNSTTGHALETRLNHEEFRGDYRESRVGCGSE